jgi:hypothetical protein
LLQARGSFSKLAGALNFVFGPILHPGCSIFLAQPDLIAPPVLFRSCSFACVIPMTTWTRQYIAAAIPADPTFTTDFDVYMHQSLYQIGNTDDFSVL